MSRYSVITGKCNKDMLCIRACLRKAIHPLPAETGFDGASQVFINPRRCIGCGACISACKSGAIFEIDGQSEDLRRIAQLNAAWFTQ
ncbi:MAG TPA: 4Fe-4S binding protein [Terracidiphilus sp.]|nr:4Fe-4S binding protein [Terracidiphilus sp.]